jgi:hypothetical protein
LPLANLSAPQAIIEKGHLVIVKDWDRPTVGTRKQGNGIQLILGNPRMKTTGINVSTAPTGDPPQFNVFTRLTISQPAQSGDIVLDIGGRVIGLVGNICFGPIIPSVPAGYIPPVITIPAPVF